MFFRYKTLIIVGALAALLAAYLLLIRQQKIDYNTQVKPIFNKHCISCHGGVRRKSGFSLLFRSEALAVNESGKPAIIPGDPEHSEMIRRLTLKDPEERMPYRHEPLTGKQIDILKAWIKQGAPWGDHWAYTTLRPVTPPGSTNLSGIFGSGKKDWIKNDIDRFTLPAMEEHGMSPSLEADKATIIRRVGFDLTGMPMTDQFGARFFSDNSEKAYENLVDSLLASPRFGEKWAAMWLDLARYADTKGYERDDARSIWRYRDWLIRSFNENKRYDVFLTEQLAGDLLPHPSDAQLIATAFHRNTMTNDEGGTDNEEFRTSAVLDRVNTTWEAIMGTTFACVQCHSHPYDPFHHDEYYRFMAFFNNTRDEDSYADYPLLRNLPDSAKQELNKLDSWLAAHTDSSQQAAIDKLLLTWQPAVNSLACDQYINAELNDTKWAAIRNNGILRLPHVNTAGKTELIYRYRSYAAGGTLQIHLDQPSGPVIARPPLPETKNGWTIASTELAPVNGVHDLYFTYINPQLTKPDAMGAMFDWFYFGDPFPGKAEAGYDEAKTRYWGLLTMPAPTTPIMMENPVTMQRVSHVFERGNWMVKGEVVTAGTPHSLNPMPAGAPANRLGLAMWMTSESNPLTARTFVNRIWEQLFGTGIAETLEDLGTQGIAPERKDLLDYLAYQFIHTYQWDIKKLLKEIVMSATYRQDSRLSEQALQKDPSNKYFARGPRVRLSAEELRDQALVVTGMLSPKMYGPSVMPYQPEGIWRSPYDGRKWELSKGEDRYRRAVYTYWKRTAPYPSMVSFDGVAREVCTARRIRTNTPLQALAGLNDEAYLDAARLVARRLVVAMPGQPAEQIRLVYARGTGHKVADNALSVLLKLYNESMLRFSKNKEAACEMANGLAAGENGPAIASLATVVNAVLNLDEVITKN